MRLSVGVMIKLLCIGVLIAALHACASTMGESGVGHEGGIVGTGNQIDCSLAQNRDKQVCREARP